MKDFFISYTQSDRAWAEWIAAQLEQAGYRTIFQARDFKPGSNFVVQMHQAASEAERTLAVLSGAYFRSGFTAAEWAAAVARDPTGAEGKLLPVRVEDCQPPGLLAALVYIDLFGRDEAGARGELLGGARRASPPIQALFPDTGQTGPALPVFPMPRPLAPPGRSGRPYKFLDYYEAADAEDFFGRERELSELVERVQTGSFLILCGASGVGKTSLVLAGLLPRLQNQGVWCLHARCLEDPGWAIKRQALKAWPAGLPSLYPALKEPLGRFLAHAQSLLTHAQSRPAPPIAIVLDQFEEFFLRLHPADRAGFLEALREARRLEPAPFRLICVIREDYLAHVDELKTCYDNPLAATYVLKNLPRIGAEHAITRPAARWGLRFEPGMVERLLGELSDRGPAEAGVFPPHLQIVCSRLAEEAPTAGRLLTWADVQKHGGVLGLLDHYVEQALSTLSASQQERAWEILKRATTALRTKLLLPAEELAGDEQASDLLERLVQRRLMRKVTEGGKDSYELAHDRLAETLNQRMTEAEKLARDLLDMVRRGFADWQRHSIPLEAEKLDLLHENARNPYLELSPEWQAFLRASRRRQRWTSGRRGVVWGVGALVLAVAGWLVYQFYPDWTTSLPLLERLRVTGGRCTLGSDDGAMPARPAHKVHLGTFAISRCEVSNRQYAAFVRASRRDPPESLDFADPAFADHPVVGVSWYEAQAFCAWLGGRLPTEAEWERACTWDDQAGRKRRWPWGERWDVGKIHPTPYEPGKLLPVDSLPLGRSPCGALHMIGNVAEWTSSAFRPYPYDPDDGREDPNQPGKRTVRGYSYAGLADGSQPTNRQGEQPAKRRLDIGFRVAWSIKEGNAAPADSNGR